jgi:hypothetical protein
LRLEYRPFYNDYKELMPGAEDEPENLQAATRTLLEYCAAQWPQQINISQVEFGVSKLFMNRELHADIEIVRMQQEAKRMKAAQSS